MTALIHTRKPRSSQSQYSAPDHPTHARHLVKELNSYNGTPITGAGLVHLTGLTRIKYIWLDDGQIDDDALEHLQKMTSLQQLLITGPQPTQARLAELRRALPRPEIKGPKGNWWGPGRTVTPRSQNPDATPEQN